jgi:hypothetical protein
MINKYGEKLDCFKARQGEVIRLTRDVIKNYQENCLLIARPFCELGNAHRSYLRASKDGTESGTADGDHYTLLEESEYECTGIMYDKHPNFQYLVDYKDYIISSIIPQPEKIGLYQEGFLFPHGSVVKLKKDLTPYKAGDILYYSCFGFGKSSYTPGYARVSKNNFNEPLFLKCLAISDNEIDELELVQAAVCNSSSQSDIRELANKFLKEAKKRYPVGTKYIDCYSRNFEVTEGKFSINLINPEEFSIHSDPNEGVLYNSKLDKWAIIKLSPPIVTSSKEIPNSPFYNTTEVIFYDPAEIKKAQSSLQELADKVNKAFENKSVEDVYLKKQKRKLDTTITPVSSVSV